MPTNDPFIVARGAYFGYGRSVVLRHINLSIHPGEFIGLIGPNGAGKSTLFNGLLKLLPAMSGEVWHAPELVHRIGYVPQKDRLDPIYPLTAWDVVQLGVIGVLPWYARAGSRRHRAWIDECLERVGMAGDRDKPFAELSSGQRQRILIARALAVRPGILMLDEPMTGVDAAAEESLLTLLSQLHQGGLTILMISHHARTLRGRAGRIIAVRQQGIVSGSPEEMLKAGALEDLP